jgi:hypothetical protein
MEMEKMKEKRRGNDSWEEAGNVTVSTEIERKV